ncbi:hypothetical protein P1K30_01195 [Psychromarinibacter halotolerans]|nr:hypothetical protein [Psychromarinibacter halotolerans]MDF0594626.1 hypothetical protein [Psychromarinibacter halotolerans]
MVAWDTSCLTSLLRTIEAGLGKALAVDILDVGRRRLEVGVRQSGGDFEDVRAGLSQLMRGRFANTVLRPGGTLFDHLLTRLLVLYLDVTSQAGLFHPLCNPVAERVLGLERPSVGGQDESIFMHITQFQFFDEFTHHGHQDIFRALLLRLPPEVGASVLELDVFWADVERIANASGHVLGQVKPATGHCSTTVLRKEFRFVCFGPDLRAALSFVGAGDPVNCRIPRKAVILAPEIRGLQCLQTCLRRTSPGTETVPDK